MAAAPSGRTLRNFQKAAKKIERYRKGVVGEVVPSGLRLIGEEVMLDVKLSRPGRGVPVDEGILRSTGRVSGPENKQVELSFGGAAAPYAIRQHEDTTLNHTVGEARYLVRGLERWKPDGSAAIVAMQAHTKAVGAIIGAQS